MKIEVMLVGRTEARKRRTSAVIMKEKGKYIRNS